MSIEVSCECAMTYRLPDRFAGKRCRCRECGDSIRVPSLRKGRATESDSSDSSDEDSEPKKPAKKAAAVKRMKSIPSESLHQMAPLNLSESRCIDPPAARARIKKAKAAAATVNAKKRAPIGPESESEIDTAPRPSKKKEKLEKKAKKKKGAQGKLEKKKGRLARHRDEDEDEDEEDERPKKKAKKGKKSADKAEKKLAKKKRGRSDDDEEEADESDESEDADAGKPKLTPRQKQKRQQMLILGGSLGALVFVAILFVIINSVAASRHAAVEKKFADAKSKIASARDVARKSATLSDAEKAYADAIAFVEDTSTPMPEDLGDFAKDFQMFKAEQAAFKTVAAARAKLATDAGAAFDEFNGLANCAPSNDLIHELGLAGLLETKDPRMAQICLPHANSTVPGIRALARQGALQYGGKEVAALAATVIREEGTSTPNGKLAVERALDERISDPSAIAAVADKDTDPQHLMQALNLMSRIGDPSFVGAVTELCNSTNDDVQKLAQRVLGELRGQEKAK